MTKKERIIKNGIKAAKKKGMTTPSNEDILELKIQTCSPVLRVFLGFWSLLFLLFAILVYKTVWLFVLLVLFAIIFGSISALGQKKTVQEAVGVIVDNGVDAAVEVTSSIIEGVLTSIG